MAVTFNDPSNGGDPPRRPPDTHTPPDDDNRSNTPSDLTELDADEFPLYFLERGGRLFHSHGGSPYPLPVDAAEQHRLNRQHAFLREFLGANFVGPVREVLQSYPGEHRHAVDLGTGTGRWVMAMASEFPHVDFDGLDIVPIQTRHPLDNVRFEMHDISTRFRYRNGTIDFVHARDISLAVANYPALLAEVARILRPGGLFVACEWAPYPSMADGSNIARRAPSTFRFFDLIAQAMLHRDVTPVARNLLYFLEASRTFERVQSARFDVPAGQELRVRRFGRPVQVLRVRRVIEVYANSVLPLLIDEHYIRLEEAHTLVTGLLQELINVPAIVFTYHTVHARRI